MNGEINVLIVGKNDSKFHFIQQLLKKDKGIVCAYMDTVADGSALSANIISSFKNSTADVILLCDCYQDISILEMIKLLKFNGVTIPIIVISSRSDIKAAVEVIKTGAENYFLFDELNYDELMDGIFSAMQAREHKEQLEKITAENLKLSQVIEQSPVSIVITKSDTNKIEYANPRFSQLTGYSFEETIGKSPNILKSGVKSKEDYLELWSTILSGKTWKGEFINRKKNGELYCVSATISPIKINNHEVTHFVGIHEDITSQKEAELKLKNYAKKLEKKSQELEDAYGAIEQNIQKAKRLHRHFFPTSFPSIPSIEFEAFYEPAHGIGSDYYNIIHLNNQLIMYVVDVSGSGIDGAFINIFIRQKINRYLYVEALNQKISPKSLVNFLAMEFVNEQFPDEYFICIFVSVTNLETMELTFSNAGIQVPPALIVNSKAIPLGLGGLPITAAIPVELLMYEEETVALDDHSTLVIATDGVVESVINGQMYGIERLHQLVNDYYFLPPRELKRVINEDLNPILENHNSHDDITYVIMQHGSPIVEQKSFVIKSDCYDVELVVMELQDWLNRYTSEVNSMLIGFHEMVYNAIEHGNRFDTSKAVKIYIEVRPTYIMITVEDEGEGFNWQSRMKRQLDIMNFEERGRGIIFTKASFDYLTYNKKGNKAYLYKKLSE